jgi:putative transposase
VQWIDVFTRKEYANIVIDSLKFCQAKKDLNIYAWCIMSNHIHLVVSATEPNNLSDILRDFKKFTSNQILKSISENDKESRKNWMNWIFNQAGLNNSRNNERQFWQQDNHPLECNTPKTISNFIKYTHFNPVRAGLVRCAEDYIYSSAIDYHTDEKGLLDIVFV